MKGSAESTMRMMAYFVSMFLLLGLAVPNLDILIKLRYSGRVEIVHTVPWLLPIEIILVGGTMLLAIVNLIRHPWRGK